MRMDPFAAPEKTPEDPHQVRDLAPPQRRCVDHNRDLYSTDGCCSLCGSPGVAITRAPRAPAPLNVSLGPPGDLRPGEEIRMATIVGASKDGTRWLSDAGVMWVRGPERAPIVACVNDLCGPVLAALELHFFPAVEVEQ